MRISRDLLWMTAMLIVSGFIFFTDNILEIIIHVVLFLIILTLAINDETE